MEANQQAVSVTKLIRDIAKKQTALCRITGILEANIEECMDKGEYNKAIDMLRDLMYTHKQNPLAASRTWKKEWKKQVEQCRNAMLDEAFCEA